MKLTLEPTEHVLSLYTPFTGPNKTRVEHTRSVLLLPTPGRDVFAIVSSVTFVLVLSIRRLVPLDHLLRYMIQAYTRDRYASFMKECDTKKHEALCRVFTQEEEEDEDENQEARHYITDGVRRFLKRIDRQNAQNYDYVMRKKLLDAEPMDKGPAWTWSAAGCGAIEDTLYREMKNINFIRDVRPVELSAKENQNKALREDAQYRILFDNHLILYFFLQRFKYGSVKLDHNGCKYECPITLLDPVALAGTNRHERFEGANYIYYVEKQLNRRENHTFCTSLSFKNTYPFTGGLLHPSAYDPKDFLYINEANTLEAMQRNAFYEDTTGQRLTKKQQEASKGFRLRYNRYYVDLSYAKHIHLEYFEREMTLSGKQETKSKKKTVVTSVKPKEVVKLGKNQPTLMTVVEKIPEEVKRKAVSLLDYDKTTTTKTTATMRPSKKPRIEQATLGHFFSQKTAS